MSSDVVTPGAPDGCPPRLKAGIDLLVGFVTTAASGNGRQEQFTGREGVLGWFAGRDLGVEPDAVTEADAVAARELREAITSVFRAHCDCETAPLAQAESYLRAAARRYPVSAIVTADGCTFDAGQSGVAALFGSVLAASAEVALQGLWGRLKVCKNPSCYAGFYDKTRNLSGQFCSPSCNSQVSMRAYRERIKSA